MSLNDWLANRWLVTHERAILSLRFTSGADVAAVDLLDRVRRQRNQINYELAGSTSSAEADELLALVTALREQVLAWSDVKHPALSIRGNRS